MDFDFGMSSSSRQGSAVFATGLPWAWSLTGQALEAPHGVPLVGAGEPAEGQVQTRVRKTTVNHWWVNQNQTYRQEVRGGYLWSPKRNKNGGKNIFYDNMTRVQAGDVVFSFSDTLIRAVGVARGGAESAPKPAEFGERGSYWGKEGWLVPVEFVEIDSPMRPKDHIEMLRPTLPAKYSPLRTNGDGLQSVYLAEIPDPMAGVLRSLLKGQVETVVGAYHSRLDSQAEEDAAERALLADPNIAATEKEQLIKARRGQGLYRSRLDTIEATCRVTGLSERAHLRASHIKPWRLSTNIEKLDGNNGLLLSPHIDYLFDRGFISFADDGGMLVSPKLDPQVLDRWNIDPAKNVGEFNAAQRGYLAFHRDSIFRP